MMRIGYSGIGLAALALSSITGGPAMEAVTIREPKRPRPLAIRRNWRGKRSKYKPHQGKQECARRVRQMERAKAKREAVA